MIADDVVEMIGELAERFGSADVGEILVGLGVAPDELRRFTKVALWSVDRVERSLVMMAVEGILHDDPEALTALLGGSVACWLDGFAIGLAVGRAEADRLRPPDVRPPA